MNDENIERTNNILRINGFNLFNWRNTSTIVSMRNHIQNKTPDQITWLEHAAGIASFWYGIIYNDVL